MLQPYGKLVGTQAPTPSRTGSICQQRPCTKLQDKFVDALLSVAIRNLLEACTCWQIRIRTWQSMVLLQSLQGRLRRSRISFLVKKILDLLSLPCRDRSSSMLGQVLVKTSLTSELLWSSGGLCALSRPCSLDASTASVAAGCGCAPRTLSGSKSAVHHLNDELRLRASKDP